LQESDRDETFPHQSRLVTDPRFTVIVPVFDEEEGLRSTVELLLKSLAAGDPFELLLVDDGSNDRSHEIMEELSRENPVIRVLRHSRNCGYGAAIKTGIRKARSPLIAITDADGTYPDGRLPELVALAADADMVVGARTGDDVEYPMLRRIPKWFMVRYASWIVGQRIPDLNSGMRVFRRDAAVRLMRILPDTFSFTTTITVAMMRNRDDVRFVPIGYSARIGTSKIRPIQDTLRFFQLILRTGMYFAPLRVLGPLIVLLMTAFAASLCYDIFVARNLTDKSVLLLLFGLNTTLFALLADMIDKRSGE
jgi:glycosyltransferase involved in cell wall biosynthesis